MISIDQLEEGTEILLQFTKRGGLLPVVVQEHKSGQVLMVAYINLEAFNNTLLTKRATFWSTSKNRLWVKGETTGDYLKIENVLIDCDQDAVVYQVTLLGDGVCHTFDEEGKHRKACFYREIDSEKLNLQFLKGMK